MISSHPLDCPPKVPPPSGVEPRSVQLVTSAPSPAIGNGTEPGIGEMPTRRSKLVVRALGKRGPYVIKDPRNGAYYQLGHEEHFLLSQCNGRRSPEDICIAFQQRFEQPLPRSDLDN